MKKFQRDLSFIYCWLGCWTLNTLGHSGTFAIIMESLRLMVIAEYQFIHKKINCVWNINYEIRFDIVYRKYFLLMVLQ